MKKYSIFLLVFMSIFLVTGMTFAATYSYNYYDNTPMSIDISGNASPTWVPMYFPDSTSGGPRYSYTNGVFEYDSYLSNVDKLQIKLTGANDSYPHNPIRIYLDFDATHNNSNEHQIAAFAIPNNNPFTLTFDFKNNELDYNGVYQTTLMWGNLNSFQNYDSFYVGYACHFDLVRTDVDVTVHDNGKVPEPATMLLLGSGLIGLWGFRKKFRK